MKTFHELPQSANFFEKEFFEFSGSGLRFPVVSLSFNDAWIQFGFQFLNQDCYDMQFTFVRMLEPFQ